MVVLAPGSQAARWQALAADPVRRAMLARAQAERASEGRGGLIGTGYQELLAGEFRRPVPAAPPVATAGDLDEALLNAARRHFARPDGEAMLASMRDGQRRLEEIRNRPRGFWPDGTRVPEHVKHAVLARWEAQRDAYYGRAPRGQVMASAGGVSPLTERIFGLG